MSQSPKDPPQTLSGRRYSRSAEQARAAEIERIWKMTPLERMALALALGRRRQALMALRAGEGDSSG